MAGIWVPSSRNVGCEQERGSSCALTTLNMGIGHHTARPLGTNFPPGPAGEFTVLGPHSGDRIPSLFGPEQLASKHKPFE